MHAEQGTGQGLQTFLASSTNILGLRVTKDVAGQEQINFSELLIACYFHRDVVSLFSHMDVSLQIDLYYIKLCIL